MRRAQTDLGRRELATAMCVKANELLNCRRRSADERRCTICDDLVAARRDAVAEFILEHGMPIDPGVVMPRATVRGVRWEQRSGSAAASAVTGKRSRPRDAAAPRTAS
ncbi:MAG: hypothetical protein ACE5JM_03670 [Armatimonadota bacterium]